MIIINLKAKAFYYKSEHISRIIDGMKLGMWNRSSTDIEDAQTTYFSAISDNLGSSETPLLMDVLCKLLLNVCGVHVVILLYSHNW